MTQETESRRAVMAMIMTLAACFIGMMVFGIGKVTGTLDPLVARRGVGAMFGLLLMATGNFVPKLRLFQPVDGAAHSDAVDRFAGWVFVGCGLGFAAIFLFAPADRIMIGAPTIAFVGFAAVLARWFVWKRGQPGHVPPYLTQGRLMLATMLVTILGAGSIFLVDAFWGDDASRWMGILFPFVLISVLTFLIRTLRRPHRES
jgi:hypothetical protein